MWEMSATNGDSIYLPIFCYHLPTADIRLMSPHSHYQMHSGYSLIVEDGTKVEMNLPSKGPGHPTHKISIPIDTNETNLPVIFNCHCNQKERDVIGPQLRSGLFRVPLDMRESWNAAQTAQARSKIGVNRRWDTSVDDFEYEFNTMQRMCCPCVGRRRCQCQFDRASEGATFMALEVRLFHAEDTANDG